MILAGRVYVSTIIMFMILHKASEFDLESTILIILGIKAYLS